MCDWKTKTHHDEGFKQRLTLLSLNDQKSDDKTCWTFPVSEYKMLIMILGHDFFIAFRKCESELLGNVDFTSIENLAVIYREGLRLGVTDLNYRLFEKIALQFLIRGAENTKVIKYFHIAKQQGKLSSFTEECLLRNLTRLPFSVRSILAFENSDDDG